MDRLGRYKVESVLGEGAMARVHLALDPEIGRRVAIKVLKREVGRDADVASRFLREARAAGALNHPNIATIYDVGQSGEDSYIAMELIDGEPLDAYLHRHGRVTCDRVLIIARQLASALDYAHRQGIVHRDIKPSNILLTTQGDHAKLVDFGVARINDVEPGEANGALVRTQAGQLVGTPRYMSPEQALGLTVDHRSDLFSLGVILYEMITGRVAFPGTALATLAIQIAQEKVEPIAKVTGDCPPGLLFIIDKLLAKKPEQRFQTGAELQKAIEREIKAGADALPSRRGFSLKIKLPAALVIVTSIALGICAQFSWTREKGTLEAMAVASGSSTASFIASNAAVSFADNASLPQAQQDWSALQAFAATAKLDPQVRDILFVDKQGIVRAAGDTRLIGSRYRPSGEAPLAGSESTPVTSSPDEGRGAGIRFAQPIRYAGTTVGGMDLVMRRDALDAALDSARAALALLAAAVILAVLLVGYLSASLVAKPLARLRYCLDEAADARFALRISHHRRDEFGAAFDAFNRAAAAVGPLLDGHADAKPESVTETRIVNQKRRA